MYVFHLVLSKPFRLVYFFISIPTALPQATLNNLFKVGLFFCFHSYGVAADGMSGHSNSPPFKVAHPEYSLGEGCPRGGVVLPSIQLGRREQRPSNPSMPHWEVRLTPLIHHYILHYRRCIYPAFPWPAPAVCFFKFIVFIIIFCPGAHIV